MDYCGLLGKNIKYSKSPQIHNGYYLKHGINLNYEIFDLQENEIPTFLHNLYINDIIGFNVTIPYKEYIINFLTRLDSSAAETKSVNTVACYNHELIGYNTDIFGFAESLKKYDINVANKSALIIGNGGVAKSVIYALTNSNIGNIDIIARNFNKIEDNLLKYDINNKFLLGQDIETDRYDLIINCTPIGGANYANMSPLNLESLNKKAVVYDLNYIPQKSLLLCQAENLGVKAINGELMLKLQAYKAIDIWETIINKGVIK